MHDAAREALRNPAERASNAEALAALEGLLTQGPDEQRAQWKRFKEVIDAERPPAQRLFR